MKQRSTTPVSKKGLATKSVAVAVAVLVAIALPTQILSHPVYADQYDAQIAAIQAQRNQYDAQAATLSQQANTLDNQKAIIQAQENAIQSQIDQNQVQYDQLKQQIAANQQKLDQNQEALGQTIANMYVDGSMSSLELLASSSNIGDYIDKQQYRTSLSDSLTATVATINQTKSELQKQQSDVTKVLNDEKAQQSALDAKVAAFNQLIASTQNQEAAYEQLSAQGAAQQSSLRQQQAEAIAAAMRSRGGGNTGNLTAGDPNHHGYPSNLANARQDAIVDPWGLYNRECVSYVAWRVFQKNGYMPYGYGNAKNWPGNAAGSYSEGSTPRVGSAGVMYAGAYGHIVWVDSINSDGTINISQYNYDEHGNYSEMTHVSPNTYDVYIYF